MEAYKNIRHSKHLKRRFWDNFKIIVAFGLLIFVFSKTSFEQLILLKEQFSWPCFWITLLLFFAMTAIKTMQYFYLIEKRVSYFRVLEIVVIQNTLMYFIATAAGIGSYLTMLGVEENVRLGRATAAFFL
ncbi:MAG TPA: hypothetical protein DCX54_01025 [Flavobacteriales bacterium]|nr:hypothetical protein [Flavobacteriales bacterium]